MLRNVIVRRVVMAVVALATVFALPLGHIEKAKAYSSLDQHVDSADGYWKIQTHQLLGQSFRPTLNKLDGVGVFAGILAAGPATCVLTISVWTGTTPEVKIGETTITVPKAETYNIADIGPLDVVPDARYIMYVTANSNDAYWLVQTSNVYSRGAAIIDSTPDAGQDFVFATFGYTGAPPAAPDPAPVVDTGTVTGGDAATDSASPSASTTPATTATTSSTTIEPPTKLTATATTDGTGAVDLAWTATTITDITGYRIYRSISETSGFTALDTTGKTVLTYKDAKAVTGQTYYYAVRAYKSSSESKNSNIVSATPTDTVAPAAPKNFKITGSSETEIAFSWDKNTETDLANYVLTVTIDSTSVTALATIDTIGKDDATYIMKLADNIVLAKDKQYTFSLQAKDISNNYSERSTVTGTFETKIVKSSNWPWIAGGVAALVLIGTIIAFLMIRKRKKSKLTQQTS